ncbi:MAG: hypothetical protein AAB373_00875 [Patescibacteria group bacterium]
MKIVFSNTIIAKEKLSEKDRNDVVKAVLKGIFILIKGKNLPVNSNLAKIYSTTIEGARRIVILINNGSRDSFFLFYRSKNDKIGENISIKNPHFQAELQKYLLILSEDLIENNYTFINLNSVP